MGTNYYTKTKKCEKCGHKPEGIHLGKSSAGWKFIFQYNGGQYYKNISEMKTWLRNKVIEDEYGGSVSNEQFWSMVEEKQHAKNGGGSHIINLEGYDFIDGYFS